MVGFSAGQGNFCSGFDSRQLHQRKPLINGPFYLVHRVASSGGRSSTIPQYGQGGLPTSSGRGDQEGVLRHPDAHGRTATAHPWPRAPNPPPRRPLQPRRPDRPRRRRGATVPVTGPQEMLAGRGSRSVRRTGSGSTGTWPARRTCTRHSPSCLGEPACRPGRCLLVRPANHRDDCSRE